MNDYLKAAEKIREHAVELGLDGLHEMKEPLEVAARVLEAVAWASASPHRIVWIAREFEFQSSKTKQTFIEFLLWLHTAIGKDAAVESVPEAGEGTEC